MKLRRRTSAGSSDSSAANTSIARSIICVASGRPAPRTGPVGVVFVATARTSISIVGIRYTPLDISAVSIARNAPKPGYAPASWRIFSRSALTSPSRLPPISKSISLGAPVVHRHEVLAAGLGPADRAAGLLGQRGRGSRPRGTAPCRRSRRRRRAPRRAPGRGRARASADSANRSWCGVWRREPDRQPAVLADLGHRRPRLDRAGRDPLADDGPAARPRRSRRTGRGSGSFGGTWRLVFDADVGEQQHFVAWPRRAGSVTCGSASYSTSTSSAASTDSARVSASDDRDDVADEPHALARPRTGGACARRSARTAAARPCRARGRQR